MAIALPVPLIVARDLGWAIALSGAFVWRAAERIRHLRRDQSTFRPVAIGRQAGQVRLFAHAWICRANFRLKSTFTSHLNSLSVDTISAHLPVSALV